jgi:hypothetical protein
MTCAQCGNGVAEGAQRCSACGAWQGAAAPQGAGQQGGHRAAVPGSAYQFDSRRWERGDWIVGGASLVTLIALFLPWYTASLTGLGDIGVASESGTNGHGWLWLVFIIVLLVLSYLVITAGFQTMPVHLPLTHERLLLGATGINFLLVLIAFVLKPGTGGEPVQIGWGIGAVLALIAALVAVVPPALAARRQP